jgi:hypothetical protein
MNHKLAAVLLATLTITSSPARAITSERFTELARRDPDGALVYTSGILAGLAAIQSVSAVKVFCAPSEFHSNSYAATVVVELQNRKSSPIPDSIKNLEFSDVLLMRLRATYPCGKNI